VSTTATSSAWDLRDSSFGFELNNSAPTAFSGDLLTLATGAWSTAFGAKYVDFNTNDALPAGFAVSGATANISFAAPAAGNTSCIYFEVRRASTGAVLATHGSSSSPLACVTGTTQQTTSTAIPEVTTSDVADDLRIRVYGRDSVSGLTRVDLATVTGTAASTAFTLYAKSTTDATGAPTTTTWGPVASGDGAAYTSSTNWATTFSTTRYLKFTFPGYVPSGANGVTGATLKNFYRPTTSGKNACWYFEVYSGSTLIGTHGSTSATVSCNSTATYSTDSISLPEINTIARANSVVVKAYYTVSTTNGTRTTQHDLVSLSVTYN
jgi:hypothetical protein